MDTGETEDDGTPPGYQHTGGETWLGHLEQSVWLLTVVTREPLLLQQLPVARRQEGTTVLALVLVLVEPRAELGVES